MSYGYWPSRKFKFNRYKRGLETCRPANLSQSVHSNFHRVRATSMTQRRVENSLDTWSIAIRHLTWNFFIKCKNVCCRNFLVKLTERYSNTEQILSYLVLSSTFDQKNPTADILTTKFRFQFLKVGFLSFTLWWKVIKFLENIFVRRKSRH